MIVWPRLLAQPEPKGAESTQHSKFNYCKHLNYKPHEKTTQQTNSLLLNPKHTESQFRPEQNKC